jgi:hypothetical protein
MAQYLVKHRDDVTLQRTSGQVYDSTYHVYDLYLSVFICVTCNNLFLDWLVQSLSDLGLP